MSLEQLETCSVPGHMVLSKKHLPRWDHVTKGLKSDYPHRWNKSFWVHCLKCLTTSVSMTIQQLQRYFFKWTLSGWLYNHSSFIFLLLDITSAFFNMFLMELVASNCFDIYFPLVFSKQKQLLFCIICLLCRVTCWLISLLFVIVLYLHTSVWCSTLYCTMLWLFTFCFLFHHRFYIVLEGSAFFYKTNSTY